MSKKFEFESRSIPDPRNPDVNAELEVEIGVSCHDEDGCDAMFEVEWIAIKGTDIPLKLEELSPEDQVYLERCAQDIADGAGPDAYRDWMIGRADAEYDRWKDDQMDSGE